MCAWEPCGGVDCCEHGPSSTCEHKEVHRKVEIDADKYEQASAELDAWLRGDQTLRDAARRYLLADDALSRVYGFRGYAITHEECQLHEDEYIESRQSLMRMVGL